MSSEAKTKLNQVLAWIKRAHPQIPKFGRLVVCWTCGGTMETFTLMPALVLKIWHGPDTIFHGTLKIFKTF